MHVGVNVLSLFALLMACEKCACLKNDPCKTTSNRAGRCVPFEQCPVMVVALNKSPLNSKDLSTLIAHLTSCGSSIETDRKDALVCCEFTEHPVPRTITASTNKRLPLPEPTTTNEFNSSHDLIVDILPLDCGKCFNVPHASGGVEDEALIHRWSVFLDLGSDGRDRCVGSVITDRHVLTAAHCLDNKKLDDITMYFGVYYLRNKTECVQEEKCLMRKPSKFIKHEMYSEDQFENDIAIIRFDQCLNMTGRDIVPICLPVDVNYSESHQFKDASRSLLSFGWGDMGGDVPSDTRRVVMLNVTTQDNIENSKTLHTKGGLVGHDVCQGDSGAPLVWVYENQMYVVGVVSKGPKCGMQRDNSSSAMRISYYIDWIKKAITS